MKKIELSDHFNYRRLLLYSLPGIGETLAITSFQVVDGYFVSNLLGINPFAAVNFIGPVFFTLYGLGFMFGSGTSAVVSQLMGEGKREQANKVFTMSTAAMFLTGLVLGGIATILMPTFARWLGASPEIFNYCVSYARRMTLFLPFFLVNAAFMSLWITAEKGWIGLIVSIINGGLNILLDWLFMAPLHWGIQGAALATSGGGTVTACITLLYFSRKNGSSLRFTRFGKDEIRELAGICVNGVSEMVSSITSNITQLVMNNRLVAMIGAAGVAAMGVYGDVIELFMAVFYGISSTTVTVAGYKYGEKNRKELDSLLRTGRILTLVLGAAVCLLCVALSGQIAKIYLGYDKDALALAKKVLLICSTNAVVTGFVLFCSSFFTGLGDGKTSALIALCNSLAAPVVMIYLCPVVFGTDGIWYSVPAAAVISAALCAVFLRTAYPKRVASLQ